MRVQMTVDMSGTRNGLRWPPSGEVVDLPDDEAQSLVSGGMAQPAPAQPERVEAAVPDTGSEEHATVPTKPAPRTRKPRKPAA